MTAFQKQVFAALLEIPKGKVVSYGELASYLEIKSAQAIGQALKKNPDSPQVPCHRVIRKDGNLGGFMGSLENNKKRDLLKAEGVIFDSTGQLSTTEAWYSFPIVSMGVVSAEMRYADRAMSQYDESYKTWETSFASTPDDATRLELLKNRPNPRRTTQTILKHIGAQLNDPSTMRAIAWIYENDAAFLQHPDAGEAGKAIRNSLLRSHYNKPGAGDLCIAISQSFSTQDLAFLEKVAKQAANEEEQGLASLAVSIALSNLGDDAGLVAKRLEHLRSAIKKVPDNFMSSNFSPRAEKLPISMGKTSQEFQSRSRLGRLQLSFSGQELTVISKHGSRFYRVERQWSAYTQGILPLYAKRFLSEKCLGKTFSISRGKLRKIIESTNLQQYSFLIRQDVFNRSANQML